MTTAVNPAEDSKVMPSTAAQRVLLLTGTAPGEPGVGGVILKDLILQTGVEQWHCCWLAAKHGQQQPYWNDVGTTVLKRQFETGFRPLRGLIGEVISAAALRIRRPGMIEAARKSVVEQCRRWQPQYILAVLESPAAIETARRLQQTVRIPLRSIVWDDVDLFCRQSHFDRWTSQRIEQAFGEVLRHSERVAVICENMQAEYRRRYGIDSIILRHGVAPVAQTVRGDSPSPTNEFRIGFAGSNTAPDCLRALIETLDAIGWQVAGRDVVLRMLGARYLLDSRKPQRIEYFGWRTVEETRSRLSECDLLYLPQSFAADNRLFSELSFPTKLSTYLAARRPILLHAPDYASLSGFWRQHLLGPEIHTLDLAAVEAAVRVSVQARPEQKQAWNAAGELAVNNAIGPAQFASAAKEFLS